MFLSLTGHFQYKVQNYGIAYQRILETSHLSTDLKRNEALFTEASTDPPNGAIMFTWSSCFMLTCRVITRHDDMKYVNMTT